MLLIMLPFVGETRANAVHRLAKLLTVTRGHMPAIVACILTHLETPRCTLPLEKVLNSMVVFHGSGLL